EAPRGHSFRSQKITGVATRAGSDVSNSGCPTSSGECVPAPGQHQCKRVGITRTWLYTAMHHLSGVYEVRAAADRGRFWLEEVIVDVEASARAARRAAVAGGSGDSP